MFLLFDIGGTKTRLALAPAGGVFGTPEIFPTPATFADALTELVTRAKNLAGTEELEAVAGGVAGTFNRDQTVLASAPHLPAWVGVPLADEIKAAFNCPVFLENDTALVGLGEATVGAGRGASIVAYLTISTGVGGVRIVDGRIDEHTHSFEPGHQILDWREPATQFEDLVSGTAVQTRTGQTAAQVTDPLLWAELSRLTAALVHNTALYWAPERVVLGGSMMRDPGLKLEIIREEFAKITPGLPNLPTLERAVLGDIGGLHGALIYLKHKIDIDICQ